MFVDGSGMDFSANELTWDEDVEEIRFHRSVSRWHAAEARLLTALLWWWPFYEQETKKTDLYAMWRGLSQSSNTIRWTPERVKAS